jgi:hypothetical protein
MTKTSCPRCEAETPPEAARCESCGFVFFEERERRLLDRSGLLAACLLAVAVALAAGGAFLLTRDDPAPSPEPPGPLAVAPAERRLETQFANAGYDDTAAVRCRRVVRLGGSTRCQVRYANGDTQLILVGLDGRGELDITIPYPAQRRPAD